MTTQEALVQAHTIVSARARALDKALAQARHLTQEGKGSVRI